MELSLLTTASQPTTEVLPALGLLSHSVTVLSPTPATLAECMLGDVVLVDCRRDLNSARAFLRVLAAAEVPAPVVGVFTEGGLIALSVDWRLDEVVLDTAGPAELDARLRLAAQRGRPSHAAPETLDLGELSIDEGTYTARLCGTPLDLTYKEFELLKFLAGHPRRVFSREHLVQEVWGYDYFGGTRTVDVHIRRLRAKLGPEHDAMIGTVRNVGYKFVPTPAGRTAANAPTRVTPRPQRARR